jgi:hypothetical protein
MRARSTSVSSRIAARPRLIRGLMAALLLVSGPAVTAAPVAAATSARDVSHRYLVVFEATPRPGGGFALGGDLAANRLAALREVEAAGGRVVVDLTRQIAVAIVKSSDPGFASRLRGSALVAGVAADLAWKGIPTERPAAVASARPASRSARLVARGPEQTTDPLEGQQWSMQLIRTPAAHAVEAGWDRVDVGILDSGIDAAHLDFDDDGVAGGSTNVDCARGRNSIPFGPGIGSPNPCVDNQFHGTHVAGIVAAQANGVGVVGVAPNVTLIPVKTCDTEGFCYAGSVVDAITYAGDQRFDVVNMSFFTDDNDFRASTEFKCRSDAEQFAIRQAVDRAIAYARDRGVVPVGALGNSDTDLANKPAPYDGDCRTVPAESPGTIGVSALGPNSGKSSYSSYGLGSNDVAAPGGAGTTGNCQQTVLSTIPGNAYGCFQGTSMASPHAAGVVALIVSRFGSLGSDGDVKIGAAKVESRLKSSAIDIGLVGYDECFGHGRVDALRAATGAKRAARDPSAPNCPEYNE